MSVSERFMTAMELPGDLSCKAPIITITGPSQVQIENYKSILYKREINRGYLPGTRDPSREKSGNISLHYLGNGNKRADFVGNVRACLKNHFRNLYAPVCSIFHLNSVAVRQYIVNPI